ncbi:MAG: response regulator [Nitrospirae bacterium]|nr:response regulator [Nitrospirota bacterium]
MAGKSILIIESNETFKDYIAEIVKRLGFKASIATDGDEGLKAAREERFDLILLSVELPNENGYIICKKFKEDNDLKNIPLILMSLEAKKTDFEQHKKLKVRAEEYIKKPFGKRELVGAISNLIGCDVPLETYFAVEEKLEALIKERDILEKDSKNKEKLIFELRERVNKASEGLKENINAEKLQKELSEAKKELAQVAQKNESLLEKVDEINKEKKELIKSSIADFAERDKRESELKKKVSQLEKEFNEHKTSRQQIKKILENALSSLKE